jgi:hypothetical protein
MFACSLQVEQRSGRQFAFRLANAELNVAYETLDRDFSGYLMPGYDLAGGHPYPYEYKRLRFHKSLRFRFDKRDT